MADQAVGERVELKDQASQMGKLAEAATSGTRAETKVPQTPSPQAGDAVAPAPGAELETARNQLQRATSAQAASDKRASILEAQLKASNEERDKRDGAVAQAQSERDHYRELAKLTEDDEKRLTYFSQENAKLDQARERVSRQLWESTLRRLSVEYDVPASDLEGFRDPLEMENAALKVYAARLQDSAADTQTPGPETATTPTVPPDNNKQSYDRGGAGNAKGSGPSPNAKGIDRIAYGLENDPRFQSIPGYG